MEPKEWTTSIRRSKETVVSVKTALAVLMRGDNKNSTRCDIDVSMPWV